MFGGGSILNHLDPQRWFWRAEDRVREAREELAAAERNLEQAKHAVEAAERQRLGQGIL